MIEKLKEYLFNRDLGLNERMFRLFSILGLGGIAMGIIFSFAGGDDVVSFIIPKLGMLLVFFVLVVLLAQICKSTAGPCIIAAAMMFVALPMNYFLSGGIYGGSSSWFLMGIMYICLVIRGKIKYLFLGSSAVVIAACFLTSYFFPETVKEVPSNVAFLDVVFSLYIVGSIMAIMIMFQNAIFESENNVAKKQKEEIEALNRMQSCFFSSMSHEIRTPINTIIGLNEMILREDVSEEVAEDAKNIRSASKMLLSLINDILDMSKIQSGNMEIIPSEYDMRNMLSDIVNMIWVRAKEKDLQFYVEVDKAIPLMLYGDDVRIKQILINILNNAVKYTEKGSVTLTICCERTQSDTVNMVYSVQDTGMGIKKESIPYLFSAFKRVDESKTKYIEGTGLGLSIVKQLVDIMDGSITVDSVYMKGSTFTVTLPQKAVGDELMSEFDLEARHSVDKREHYKQSFEAPEANVLIVDDNQMNLTVAEKLLKNTKVRTRTATSGALCLKETAHTKFDVIFMDHIMPVMDGIECMHAIRKQAGEVNKDTPIVILTANANSEDRALYEREGADGYLIKPVTGEQLERELLIHLPRERIEKLNTAQAEEAAESVLLRTAKPAIMISTDSVCDLPKDMVEEYGISVMPYFVYTNEGVFAEGTEINTRGLLSYMDSDENDVHFDAPEVSDYEKYFSDRLSKAQHIIHISMGKKSSAGYDRASKAADSFENVTVIDSGEISGGLGLIVIRAAEFAASGRMTAQQVVDYVNHMKDTINTTFIVKYSDYISRAGSLSVVLSRLFKSLMIYPRFSMRKIGISLIGVTAGSKERVWKRHIGSSLKKRRTIDKRLLIVSHVGLTLSELQDIEKEVRERVPFKKIVFCSAAPTVASLFGRGAYGLHYARKYVGEGETADKI